MRIYIFTYTQKSFYFIFLLFNYKNNCVIFLIKHILIIMELTLLFIYILVIHVLFEKILKYKECPIFKVMVLNLFYIISNILTKINLFYLDLLLDAFLDPPFHMNLKLFSLYPIQNLILLEHISSMLFQDLSTIHNLDFINI